MEQNAKVNGKRLTEKFTFFNVNIVEKSTSHWVTKTVNTVAMIAIFGIGFGEKKMQFK